MTQQLNSIIDNQTNIQPPSVVNKPHASNKAEGGGVSDAVIWAYALLIDAVSTQSQTAVIHAKALQANASAQQLINAELRQEGWYSIPKVQKKVDHHEFRKWSWDGKNPIPYFGHFSFPLHHRKHHWTTTHVLNQGAIDAANAANTENNKTREDLQAKLSVLQQLATVEDAGVNNITNESVQTLQAASAILGMLKALTNKILLHR